MNPEPRLLRRKRVWPLLVLLLLLMFWFSLHNGHDPRRPLQTAEISRGGLLPTFPSPGGH